MSRKKYRGLKDLDALIVLGSSNFTPKKKDKYIREKIRMLYKDFLIPVSDEDKKRLYSLETERAIDMAVGKIIKERL